MSERKPGRPKSTEPVSVRTVPTNPCAACKRGGIECKHRHMQIIATLRDASGKERTKRGARYPLNSSEGFLREKAAFWLTEFSKRGISVAVVEKAERQSAGGSDWWDKYFAWRESKGLTPTRGMYEAHIKPVLGQIHPRDWTKLDCETFRDVLDEKIEAGRWHSEARKRSYNFGWKRARNIWALFTSACKKASSAKKRTGLKVREDYPCAGVEPPDGGSHKLKQWLTPDESTTLLGCPTVPIRWLTFYALLTYTYLRPNELRALQKKNINFTTRLISVDNAWDFENDQPKAYPKSDAGVRKVPIEPAIEFVLRQLCEGLAPDDYVMPNLPPREDWAATLRAHLRRAGVDRPDLYENSATVKHITLYDLRATGITWRTLRGDDTREIQRAAGHEHYDTTDGYVRETAVYRGRVGEPFPALPEVFRSRFTISAAGGAESS